MDNQYLQYHCWWVVKENRTFFQKWQQIDCAPNESDQTNDVVVGASLLFFLPPTLLCPRLWFIMCFVWSPFLAHNTAIRIEFYGSPSSSFADAKVSSFLRQTCCYHCQTTHSAHIIFNMQGDKIKEEPPPPTKLQWEDEDASAPAETSFCLWNEWAFSAAEIKVKWRNLMSVWLQSPFHNRNACPSTHTPQANLYNTRLLPILNCECIPLMAFETELLLWNGKRMRK